MNVFSHPKIGYNVANARISNGVSAVSCGGYYSENELAQFKKTYRERIENEMSAKSKRNVHLLEIENELPIKLGTYFVVDLKDYEPTLLIY